MRLIVDTNRILAALIKGGLSRTVLSSKNLEFYTLDFALQEVHKYIPLVMKKSSLSREHVLVLLDLLMENVLTVSDKEVQKHFKKAHNIMIHIDECDAPILACALAIQNDGIWTEDKDFHKQTAVKVWNTQELLKFV